METTRLPIGRQAALDVDCLRIEEQADGTYKLTASALCAGEEDASSVSIVDAPPYQSAEQAERDGIAWAEDVGVKHLYISTGTLAQPLNLKEMDLPL